MKLLLDECIDQRLRNHIPDHEIFTVGYMGWAGKKNGELLRLAAAAGFNAVLTTDHGIPHQHNPARLPLSVVWLKAKSNDLDDLLVLIPPPIATLTTLKPRTFRQVL